MPATCPRHAPVSSSPVEAWAAAQASGLAMNVGPCISTGASPLEMPCATRREHRTAASVR